MTPFFPARSGHARAWTLPLVWLIAALSACGDDGSSASEPDDEPDAAPPASCEPIGKSVACTGPGGCAGAQVCQDDGRYGACDCGDGASGSSGSGGGGSGAGSDNLPPLCGVACMTDDDCGGRPCIQERAFVRQVEGLGEVQSPIFPGGMCATACDPNAEIGEQGCGDCGVCFVEQVPGGLTTVCLERCEPSADDSGCSREGYTCTFGSNMCLEAQCQSDEDCRLYPRDSDGDGEADTTFYDESSEAVCNADTGRCQTAGKADAQAGDPCERNDDCEADGYCQVEADSRHHLPFAGGYCLKYGCDVDGLGCDGEGVCSSPRPWFLQESLGRTCARSCEVGAESAEEQLGEAGHGAGCRAGYMCSANQLDDSQGTCLPGNYNAVTANNVGDACEDQADCYSPFGHGRCATDPGAEGVISYCTVFDCGTPGLPEDVCGEGNLCVFYLGLPSCLRSCASAEDCAAGLACIEIEGDESVCLFGCETDAECREGEICSQRTGLCIAASET